jgi:Mce-associated membrane protein
MSSNEEEQMEKLRLPSLRLASAASRIPPVATLRVLAVLAVVLIATTTFLGFQHHGQDAESNAKEVQKTAATSMEALLSYDFRTIDGLVTRNQGLVTGQFSTEYKELVKGKIEPTVTQRRLKAETEVVASGVESMSDDRAVLVMFLNQDYGAVGQGDLSTSGSRVRVTMVKADGRWKVSKVNPV